MAIFLLALAVLGIPAFILLKNDYGKKKGCGRGCSTCGNRNICHGSGKYKNQFPDQSPRFK